MRAKFLETDSGMMAAEEIMMQQSTPRQDSAVNRNFAFAEFWLTSG
jgi:hypothetical protein